MFEIIGLNKETLRTEQVAIASNYTEALKIIEQETERYIGLMLKKLRVGR